MRGTNPLCRRRCCRHFFFSLSLACLARAGARGGEAREVGEGAQGAGCLGRGFGRGGGGLRLVVRGGRGRAHDSRGHRLLPFPRANIRHPRALQGRLIFDNMYKQRQRRRPD